jgi:hypothetical protein
VKNPTQRVKIIRMTMKTTRSVSKMFTCRNRSRTSRYRTHSCQNHTHTCGNHTCVCRNPTRGCRNHTHACEKYSAVCSEHLACVNKNIFSNLHAYVWVFHTSNVFASVLVFFSRFGTLFITVQDCHCIGRIFKKKISFKISKMLLKMFLNTRNSSKYLKFLVWEFPRCRNKILFIF